MATLPTPLPTVTAPLPSGSGDPRRALAAGWLDLVEKHGLSTVLVVVLIGYLLWDRVTTTGAMIERLDQLRELQSQTVVLLQQQGAFLAQLLQCAP